MLQPKSIFVLFGFYSKGLRSIRSQMGSIYRRTITRRDKQYQEAYFRYRDELGKLQAKYIPQRLLDRVQEAESRKKPIAEILILLGGDGISRGEHSSTLNNRCVRNEDKSDELISVSRGEQSTPPSTKKRPKGYAKRYALAFAKLIL